MAITKNGQGQILYTKPQNARRDEESGTVVDDEFAIVDETNVLKQIKFKIIPTDTNPGVITFTASVGADATVDLTSGGGGGASPDDVTLELDGDGHLAAKMQGIAAAYINAEASDLGTAIISNGDGTASFQTVVTNQFTTTTSIDAVSGVPFTGTFVSNAMQVVGNGGAVTVTSVPAIGAATNSGQMLILIGTSNTNTVTINSGTGVTLASQVVLGLNDTITLLWVNNKWVETCRAAA